LPYYVNIITGKTQWGYYTFFGTKIPLPKVYIGLLSNGNPVYKYIGKKLNSHSHSPIAVLQEVDEYVFHEESISLTYKQLKTLETNLEAKNELLRRSNLFEKVAFLLKCTPESIIDESLDFLANKAQVSLEDIIEYIKKTEKQILRENASLTVFSKLSDGFNLTDFNEFSEQDKNLTFLRKRSIRELCGLNMREEELSSALKQLGNLTCGITLDLMHEPVMTGCPNGHTCDKESMKDLFKSQYGNCPGCNVPISRSVTLDTLIPNHFAKKIIEEFVEKYVNQRGEIWDKINDICVNYTAVKIDRENRALLAKTAKKEAEEYIASEADARDARVAEDAARRTLPIRRDRNREAREAERRQQEERDRAERLAREDGVQTARQEFAQFSRAERDAIDNRRLEEFERARAERLRLEEQAREERRLRLEEERARAAVARQTERALAAEKQTEETNRLATELQGSGSGFRYNGRTSRKKGQGGQ